MADLIPIPVGIPWDPWEISHYFPFPCTSLLETSHDELQRLKESF